jgi:hypothetical protein
MGSGETLRQTNRLDRLFAVLMEEARERPDFADRLLSALTDEADPDAFMMDGDEDEGGESPFAVFSCVAVLHTEGVDRLRECLSIIPNKEQLLQLAEDQHIPVSGDFSEAPLADVVEAVIEGTKFRLEDRLAAAS